jgi:preprotein translocase subunit SecF
MRPLKLVPDNTNIGFLRWRWVALTISVVLLVGSIGIVATKGLNWGVDFVGGQQMRITFMQPVAIGELRNRIEALDVGEVSIQQLGDGKSVNIPSYLVRASDTITIREKSRAQLRIKSSLDLAEANGFPSWVEVDPKNFKGVFKSVPDRSEIASDVNEQLVVELYSK